METSTPGSKTFVKVFLFTDMVGSTDLKRRLGDAAGAEAIARHDLIFRRCLPLHHGREEDNAGDGFFATFDRPSDALRCALDFLRALREVEDPQAPLGVRLGIDMGEIIRVAGHREEGTGKLIGPAVDTAARIMALAQSGQVLLSRSAFDLARQQVLAAPDGSRLTWLAHGPYLRENRRATEQARLRVKAEDERQPHSRRKRGILSVDTLMNNKPHGLNHVPGISMASEAMAPNDSELAYRPRISYNACDSTRTSAGGRGREIGPAAR